MKVLVVDDHALITDALRVLLLDIDAEAVVLTAGDAAGAERLLELHPDADLMLLDLALPDASGTSVLESLVTRAPDLKILVLSGVQDQRSVMHVLQLGAAGFVPKSMASDTLASAIRFVLSGGVYIPADLLDDMTRGASMLGLPERGRDMLGQPTSSRMRLTERQEQVLQLLALGAPIKTICRQLGLSEGTVKTHVSAIYRAFGASNRTEALLVARRQGYDVG
ncbi:MAG: response regulator [Betaproteobacteria bacterium]|jgi:DNA-binding NarL/FixJ family response regulator